MRGSLLKVDDLRVSFSMPGGKNIYAVRGISFEMEPGESIGIVGESGSGKSTAVEAIQRLTSGEIAGTVYFEGQEIKKPEKNIGMIFQDPMSALNPTMRIGSQIIEGILYHKIASKQAAKQRGIELLEMVGILDPESRFSQYPHELSGGMKQRVLIAMALASNPRLLIADEPTTSLDAVLQLQILDLIGRIKTRFEMGLLLISHDFAVIESLCEKVLVMYGGKIVEQGRVEEVFRRPRHPYTEMLIQSLPRFDRPRGEVLKTIEGSPPNLQILPQGCSFKDRCPYATLKCREEEPSGTVACWKIDGQQ